MPWVLDMIGGTGWIEIDELGVDTLLDDLASADDHDDEPAADEAGEPKRRTRRKKAEQADTVTGEDN